MTNDLKNLLDLLMRTPEDTTGLLVAADKACEDGEAGVEWCLRLLASVGPGHRCSTGSRVYGTPKPESDYDWVVFPDPPDYDALWAACDQTRSSGKSAKPPSDDYPDDRLCGSYRYGPLNLIVTDRCGMFDPWREGTEELTVERVIHGPRKRDQAIAVFQKHAAKYRV